MERRCGLRHARQREPLVDEPVEASAIGEAGQRIAVREPRHLGFGTQSIALVADRDDDVRALAHHDRARDDADRDQRVGPLISGAQVDVDLAVVREIGQRFDRQQRFDARADAVRPGAGQHPFETAIDPDDARALAHGETFDCELGELLQLLTIHLAAMTAPAVHGLRDQRHCHHDGRDRGDDGCQRGIADRVVDQHHARIMGHRHRGDRDQVRTEDGRREQRDRQQRTARSAPQPRHGRQHREHDTEDEGQDGQSARSIEPCRRPSTRACR